MISFPDFFSRNKSKSDFHVPSNLVSHIFSVLIGQFPYIQTVIPFYVATAMIGVRKSSFMIPNGDQYARSAVATIGVQKTTFGCWSHAIQVWHLKEHV